MSTEQVGTADATALDTALQGLRDVLQADGYELEWSLEEQNQIAVQVVAGTDACADCLVPEAVMRTILSDALSHTSYQVGRVSLPAKS
jgi:hypothetical protein